MAPITTSSDEHTHQALLDQLDMQTFPKPFRNPTWKPSQRRNKSLKQMLADAARKEASMIPSQAASGSSTPLLPQSGGLTPSNPPTTGPAQSNIAQAAQQRLDRLVLERNQNAALSADGRSNVGGGATMQVTYTNIEAAPSMSPKKKYCDVTGIPTTYTDPKSGLNYYNAEVYKYIRTLPQSTVEQYLSLRGAHTVLK
ncbi:putative trans-2-enoyl-CoA reductase [Venturia nashicola]|uniref:Putative trans-2-enoyl-CoA reductase n=1 Tax=Venturia nashicola TaxID=86259 RepID=A0A4Z1P7I8_9PEZI|nr:putative trans-2-enoyl-CoA reductase [Venturia nashicola]TLD37395.1 putative trans-2-enoyl-CoA reductase [Venturia nashicola]